MSTQKTVGLIAMGSALNRPFWQDMIGLLETEIRVEMRGVVDGLTKEEIEEQFAFEEGDNYIVTEMYWGGTVHISEEKARIRVACLADELFNEGADTVLVLCTGNFYRPGSPEWENALRTGKNTPESAPPAEKHAYNGLFLLPEDLLLGLLSGLKQESIGFIVPEEGQIRESEEYYERFHPVVKAASPYGSMEKLRETAGAFRNEPVQVIVTDCMGFQKEMGRMVAEESGKQVIVPRFVLPKLIRAMLIQD